MSSEPQQERIDVVPPAQKIASSSRGVAYVLWGDGFDEVMAVRLLTALRKLAVQSFLVGLRAQGMRGAHGVTLVPNLTLDEALPARHPVRWIVLPWSCASLRSLLTDPRVVQLLTAPATIPIVILVLQSTLAEELRRLNPPAVRRQLLIHVCAEQMTEAGLMAWLARLGG